MPYLALRRRSALPLIGPLVRLLVVGCWIATSSAAADDDRPYVPADVRFNELKDYNGYFPFAPPANSEAWHARSEQVRRRVLVSQGLWPLPTKTPLNAVVHSPVERDGYTVHRVYFESLPGHFVCGSLYKPKGFDGPRPVILSAHGHWADARFHDAGEAQVAKQIAVGAEKYQRSGRNFLQAQCVQLARLGCVVFQYDMEGYSDAKQLPFDVVHRYGAKRPAMETAENWGFFSPQAESRVQSVMGLQTWNSVRALDFVTSLPEVDPRRIGVTGASGGGTQTMLLGAIDPRVTAIVPAVMVSTAMQGGCTCENASLLRIETGNVEFAALFAPKPQALLAADDWTREIMTKGFPELKQLYKLLGVEDRVEAYPYTQFPHNYTYVSRAAMYEFFNKHSGFGAKEPIVETDIDPLSPAELTVWTKDHQQPPGGEDHERAVVRHLTTDARRQIEALAPRDSGSIAAFREVVGGGLDVVLGRRLTDAGPIEQTNLAETDRGEHLEYRCLLRDPARGEEVVTAYWYPKRWNKEVVLWLDGRGIAGLVGDDGRLKAAPAELLKRGYAVAAADLLGQGLHTKPGFPADKNRRVKNPRLFTGYTFGYNHPLFVQRVHDVLGVIAHARAHHDTPAKLHLVGLDGAGPIAAAAAAQCGEALESAAIDTAGFRFERLTDDLDPSFVPGIVKYGDLPALLALGAPHRLWLAGESDVPKVVEQAYAAHGNGDRLTRHADRATGEAVVEWLTKRE